MAVRRIVQGSRNRSLDIDHVVVAQPVKLSGRDAGLDERRDVIEDFGSEPAGYAHPGDISSGLDDNSHDVDVVVR